MRFDDISKYPPIFPFEEGFTRCECIVDVANIMRHVQVDPQSNWAYSIYCSQDMTDMKAKPGEKPDLDYTIDYELILEQIVDGMGNNEEVEEEVKEEKGISVGSDEQYINILEEKSNEEPIIIQKSSFLPSDDVCNEILRDF